ncbi:MAG: glycoside hydrolase family 32 protein [Lachnospiraceae bacterium]|jgi:beta-fructofuranosidase|nr:glycoside hydrolase family 32 protein [Lachnospiraceae bacterium]
MCEFRSKEYHEIHIFAQIGGGKGGFIRLYGPNNQVQELYMGEDHYRMIRFPLEEDKDYRLESSGVMISQMYLTECERLLEKGICFLHPETGQPLNLEDWYNTPWREQYHFGPFINWVNDPNGLCWYEGYYHLFFQANPYGQMWNDMYWGHAVSRDLVHWTHMPFALEPQPMLWKDPDRKGGAFSGSAAVKADGIHLYLTRHDGPQTDGADTLEWQTKAICRDGIHITEERDLITEKPQGASFDFRDPKVVKVGETWYMVLGSCIDQIPAFLLYQKMADKSWQYKGTLLTEKRPGIRTFECPDFFPLDGKFAAIAAWMCHRDEGGRYQMTRCYIGDFDGKSLTVESEQWLDFGSNFYAVQTFEHQGRRVAIGWVSDFYQEHRNVKNGAYGSYALPRELSIKQNRLYMKPVAECYQLLGEVIFETSGEKKIPYTKLPGNCFYVKVRLGGDGDFKLLLAKEGKDGLFLVRGNGVTSIVSTKPEVRQIHFPSDVKQVRDIEIFVDRRLVEVFLNEGEGAGTKLFYQNGWNGCLEGEFTEGDLIELEVRKVNSIWN